MKKMLGLIASVSMAVLISCTPAYASGASYADKLDASSQMGIVLFAVRHGCAHKDVRSDAAFAKATLKKLQAAFKGYNQAEVKQWLNDAGIGALYKDLGNNADLTCDLYEGMKAKWIKEKHETTS